MPESYGGSFPTVGVQQGARHVSSVNGLIYRYLGGDPASDNNWIIDGGTVSVDPDTSGWGTNKIGATWYNTTDREQKYWTGAYIRSTKIKTEAIVAGEVTIDGGLSDYFRIALDQNITNMNMLSERDGQKIIVEVMQDATGSRTIVWASNVRFSEDLDVNAFIPSANPLKKTYFGLVYNGSDGRFDALAVVKGF